MTAPPPMEGTLAHRTLRGIAHPLRWVHELCGGTSAYPLLILFGLNMADELDRSAFTVLLPEIRDSFGLDNTGILSVVAVAGAVALLLTVPIAQLADRSNRVHLALGGALVWALFSLGTGLAPVLWVLVVARSGAAIGQGVVFPTHNSLLADYYPPAVRPRVFSFHRAATSIGVIVGVLAGAGIAQATGSWRWAFIAFAFPTVALVVAGSRMHDPSRGRHEREAMGATDEVARIEEPPPSFAEAYRMVWKIKTLRRIFWALPFLAASLVGFASLAAIQYSETFGLDEVQRALANVPVQLVELVGVAYGARLSTRLFHKDPALVFRFLAGAAILASVLAAMFALAPSVPVAIVANAGIGASLAVVGPGILASLSLAIPPRARSVGFSIGALFILPGLVVIPLVGAIGDSVGLRWGMLLLTPVFVVGGLIIASAGSVIGDDIEDVWRGAAARAEMLNERRHGRQKLLLVRQLDVAYGDVQILFGVDFEVDEGEIVALLGTNGAGKSTLLKAIAGVVEADQGAVILDGRDITHAPPEEIAALGVAQVPGGQGVFPSLTVGENLRVAGWLERRHRVDRQSRLDEVYELFPVLRDRLHDPAANLSGGQQQMLALSMAFLGRPKLLVIDELSLGLAPVIVEQLLGIVRAMRDHGTTVILVEQSVNVALTVAETAYFMEKGEIRFHGPTSELLERPDVLRSVFLEGAQKGLAARVPVAPARQAATDETSGPGPAPSFGAGTGTEVQAESTDHVVADAVAAGGSSAAVVAPVVTGGPALRVEGLSVHFGGIRAVDSVGFTVAPGEVLGIIGPNGAGKTTVFDLISGFTRADEGRVDLLGVDVTRRSAAARARAGLGRSFQDARLFSGLTVEETLAVALERWIDVRDPLNAVFRMPAFADSEADVHARVDELIDLMGIGSFRSKFVHELSTGSRRVVDLACVLAHRPSVVLFDEPSSGIAQREAEALGPLLLRIRDTLGAAVVLIEHDMPLITSVADRLIALDQGRVVTEGTPAAVLAHPEVVASYLGSTDEVIARSGARTPPGPIGDPA